MNRKMVVLAVVLAAVLVGGVVLATVRGKAMTGLTSILPTIKQQQVAIVKDASNKDTSAFSPNPVQIQPGTTVVWSNNDNTPHTITSGMGLNDTNKGKAFDSGPIAIGKTYSHKFDVAGTYDYFCTLHPTMVGTVSVK
ncbi:MAG: hypothetical protein E6K92_09575 [Thaumarchaeota archaeon]|nr:MAG: hypothetical protein E6K92_09575 [Nitrososphaerota archaeon]